MKTKVNSERRYKSVNLTKDKSVVLDVLKDEFGFKMTHSNQKRKDKEIVSFNIPTRVDQALQELLESGLWVSQSEIIRNAIIDFYCRYYFIIKERKIKG